MWNNQINKICTPSVDHEPMSNPKIIFIANCIASLLIKLNFSN